MVRILALTRARQGVRVLARRALAATLAALLVAGAPSPASAGLSLPGIPDPAKWILLGKILNWLYEIEVVVRNINGTMDQIKGRLQVSYPLRALDQIRALFRTVRSIQDEITDLSCAWELHTPRVSTLWDGLFDGVRLCKPEWELIWGAPLPGPDRDLQELYNAAGVVRMNALSASIEKDAEWTEYANWLAWEAAQAGNPYDPGNPYSPGYSLRLSAQGAAFGGMLAVDSMKHEALDGWRKLLEWQEERRLERHPRTLALLAYDITRGVPLDQVGADGRSLLR